jgi:entericidin B
MRNSLTLLVLLATIAACNTIQGAGEDINAAGKAISNSAQKTKDAISK